MESSAASDNQDEQDVNSSDATSPRVNEPNAAAQPGSWGSGGMGHGPQSEPFRDRSGTAGKSVAAADSNPPADSGSGSAAKNAAAAAGGEDRSSSASGAASKVRDAGFRSSANESFAPISEQTLARIRELYVERDDFPHFLERFGLQSKETAPVRIVMLIGPPGMGKMATAVHLASRIIQHCGEHRVLQYQDVNPPLVHSIAARLSDEDQPAVLIVNGFLSRSLQHAEDAQERLSSLNAYLRRRGHFLILVCHEQEDITSALAELRQVLHFANWNCSSEFIRKVAGKHLDFYRDAYGDFDFDEEFWDEIKQLLMPGAAAGKSPDHPEDCLLDLVRTPAQVAVIFEQLSRVGLNQQPDEDAQSALRRLIDFARESDRRRARDWFRGLPHRVQLYAMAVQLFRGLEQDDVYALYIRFTEELFVGQGDASAVDWRGLEDLNEEARVSLATGETLRFSLPVYAQEVESQLASFRHQLWLAMENTVIPLVESHREPQFWLLRMHLGRAIGRLGFYEWPRCQELLNRLAAHANSPMRALCQHIFSGLFLQIQHVTETQRTERNSTRILKALADLLREWSEHDSLEPRWTAVVSCWAAFEFENNLDRGMPQSVAIQFDELRDSGFVVLETTAAGFLSDIDDEQRSALAGPLMRSVSELMGRDCERTVGLLRGWLEAVDEAGGGNCEESGGANGGEDDESDSGADAGPAELDEQSLSKTLVAMAMMQPLCEEYGKQAAYDRRLREQLLHLATDLFACRLRLPSDDDSENVLSQAVCAVATMIGSWLEEPELDSEVRNHLLNALVPAIDSSREFQRHSFVMEVYKWLHKRSEKPAVVDAVGRLLLLRATFADGRCMDAFGDRRVLLLLDSSTSIRQMRALEKLATQLAEQLRLESEVYWGRMGTTIAEAYSDSEQGRISQQSHHDHVRLIMPLLEKYGGQQMHYAIILTGGEVHDWKDACFLQEGLPEQPALVLALPQSLPESADGEEGLLSHFFRLHNNEHQRVTLRNLLRKSRELLEYSLVRRSETEWKQILGRMDLADDSASGVQEGLQQRLQQHSDDFQERARSLQQAQSCLQWLFLFHCERCVTLLEDWNNRDGDRTAEHVAGPCAHMMIRLLHRCVQVAKLAQQDTPETHPSFPQFSRFAAAARLGRLVARDDSIDAISSFFRCVSELAVCSEWRRYLIYSGELAATIDELTRPTRHVLETRLAADIEELEEQSQTRKMLEAVQYQLRLGRRGAPLAEARDKSLILVIYDSSDADFTEIARRLLAKKLACGVAVQGWRLGVAVPVDGNPERLDPLTSRRIPPLLGPIVEYVGLRSIAHLVLLSRERPADLTDYAKELASRGHFCCLREKPDWAPGWMTSCFDADVNTGTMIRTAVANIRATITGMFAAEPGAEVAGDPGGDA